MVTRTRLNVTLYVHCVVIVVVVDLYWDCLRSKLFQNMLISFDRVSKTEHPNTWINVVTYPNAAPYTKAGESFWGHMPKLTMHSEDTISRANDNF